MAAVFCDFNWELPAHRSYDDPSSETGSDISSILYNGVATLSSTDSSRSSGTSDITEPCSPPSPDTPRSCTPQPPATVNGYHGKRHCCGIGSEPFTPVESERTKCNKSPSLPGEVPALQPPSGAVTTTVSQKGLSGPALVPNGISTPTPTPSTVSACETVCDNVESLTASLGSESGACEESCKQSEESCKQSEESCKQSDAEGFCVPQCKTPSPVQATLPCTADPVVLGDANHTRTEATPNQELVNAKAKEICNISFPKKAEATSSHKAVKSDVVQCLWDKCTATMKSTEVVEHLQGVHVSSQMEAESFVCLWSGCKVFDKKSCSLSWLERHVLTHAGSKPFQCIVDGCGQRFTTQASLERHVNGHFNHPGSSGNGSSNGSVGSGGGVVHRRGRDDSTPSKMAKRRRVARFRRRSWSVKGSDDFFDAGIMECVQHHLVIMTNQTRLGIDTASGSSTDTNNSNSSSSITFQSSVKARRTDASGKVQYLVHWIPENFLPDEWVSETQLQADGARRTVPLAALPGESLAQFDLAHHRHSGYRKTRRK